MGFVEGVREMAKTIEISVKEDVKVTEGIGVQVTPEQKKFLERFVDWFRKFKLDEIYVTFVAPNYPGAVTFKIVKKE